MISTRPLARVHASIARGRRLPQSAGARVALELCRIDDRLIHGQVVLGWGQQMRLGYIVLVDDEVAESEWERELYRMGVPPEGDVIFETVKGAATRLAEFESDPRPGILLTGDVESMVRLVGMCTAL